MVAGAAEVLANKNWGREDRAKHGDTGRGDPARPQPSRAGVPLLPGHHAPGQATRP